MRPHDAPDLLTEGETPLSVNLSLTQSYRFGKMSRDEYLAELAERNADWAKLTPTEQLVALDRRLGVGVGAKRQRTKLAAPVVEKPKADALSLEAEAAVAPKKKKFKKGKKQD